LLDRDDCDVIGWTGSVHLEEIRVENSEEVKAELLGAFYDAMAAHKDAITESMRAYLR
jgi:hypothetical protein